jgi:hypothetical protein
LKVPSVVAPKVEPKAEPKIEKAPANDLEFPEVDSGDKKAGE